MRKDPTVTSTPLTEQNLRDILLGATFLGSGGGGPRAVGANIIDSLVAKGTLPTLISTDALPATAWGAVSAFAGSPDSAAGPNFDWSPATHAAQQMAQYLADRGGLSYLLPVELGGGNSFIPLAVGASLGVPVVDAAGAARAVPSLVETSYAEQAVAVSPMMMASPTDTMSCQVSTAAVADNVLRSVVGGSAGFGNEAGIALWPMAGATATAAAIGATTSWAMGLGQAIRTAPAGGAVAAALAYTGGYQLAVGEFSAIDVTTTGGFDMIQIQLACTDGTTASIFAQNENLLAWSSASVAPLGLAPDLLCWITPDGVPFSNADDEFAVGQPAALIGVPAPAAMRTPYMIKAFAPQLFALGYGGPWQALADLAARR